MTTAQVLVHLPPLERFPCMVSIIIVLSKIFYLWGWGKFCPKRIIQKKSKHPRMQVRFSSKLYNLKLFLDNSFWIKITIPFNMILKTVEIVPAAIAYFLIMCRTIYYGNVKAIV